MQAPVQVGTAPLSRAYYEQYLTAQRTHWWFRGRERILQALVRSVMGAQAGLRVADVGSGPGGPARKLFPEAWLAAFDLSLQPLSAYVEADEHVAADATQMPCHARSFDVVCAFDVLEHLDEDRRALQEWRRILAPTGLLLLTVPAYRALWSAHDVANAHRRRYRLGPLRTLLGEAGFVIERLTYFNTFLLPGVVLIRGLERVWKRSCADHGETAYGELDFQERFPQWIERCCEAMLASEAGWLRSRSFPAGVSIGAIARVDERRAVT
mgnify:CR=1 FL=1